MSNSAYAASGKANLVIDIPEKGSSGSANATPEDDMGVPAGESFSSATLYSIIVDCTNNPNEDVTFRLYDNASPSVGTTVAEVWVPGKRGQIISYEWPIGIPFGTALSSATVKGAGGTGGSTNPSGTVKVTVVCDLTLA